MPLVSASEIDVILSVDQRRDMKVTVAYETPLVAPVAAGQKIGVLKIETPGAPTREFPLLAGGDVERQGIFSRAFGALTHLVFGS